MKSENEKRILIAEFLNDEYSKEEIMFIFDLKKCDRCGNVDLEENIEFSNYGNDYICDDCRKCESI